MFIKSIVLDGFKSYGQRTEIHGFDKEFNAITGLNGSGKSNILDSICFVLGITNLSQVRAGSLQDLIYKNGQAGITKATVSIVFDNSDKEQCPPGFEQYRELTITRQVMMGGKSRYMLNGSVVQNKLVNDLFCSVQLNVNNPHFLIMQGRITKVLNMKPPEILSMMEEAAGTRMYEVKRIAAQRNLEKKMTKYNDLDTIFKEEVTPKIHKLKEERKLYQEYQRLEGELEHLMKLYHAWQFYSSQRLTVTAKGHLDAQVAKIDETKSTIAKNKENIKKIEEEVKEMITKTKSEDSEKLADLENQLKVHEKEETTANAAEKASTDAVSSEEKRKKQLEKNLKDDEKALATKEQELSKVKDLFEKLKNNDEADTAAFALSQKKFEAVSAGMEVNEEGKAETLQEQLMGAKTAAAEAKTEYQKASMEIAHFQNQLKEKEKELKATSGEQSSDVGNIDRLEKEIKALEKTIGGIQYSEEKMVQLQERRRQCVQEGRALRQKVENFEAQRPYTQFTYRDPESNFNRKSVFGVVCKLVKVEQREAAIALETAAGGKLYNVIVDTDVTSKKLLSHGNLQQRTTFIPLNKIQSGKITPPVEKFAQDLVGADNVQAALSLITYNKRLQPAMEYVFGNTFVCKDLNVAKKVAFHPKIMKRCVTLDGDVVEPAGVLSGGARQKSEPVLLLLEQIVQSEERLKAIEQENAEIEAELTRMASSQERWRQTKNQLELKQHELGLIQKRLQHTSHHQLKQEVEELKNSVATLTARMNELKQTEQLSNQKAKELEAKVKDSKGYKERQLKEAEAEMKRLKLKADKSKEEWKKREQEYETLILEISELKKEIESLKEQIAICEENLMKMKEKHVELKEQAKEIKAFVAEMLQQVKKEKAAISEKNRDIQHRNTKKEQLTAQINELELEIKKMEHERKKLEDEHKNCMAREKELTRKVKNNATYLEQVANFTDHQGEDLERQIRMTQEKRHRLGRTVNTKVQSMLEMEEKKHTDIKNKLKTIQNDKQRIQTVIDKLERKKIDVIKLAWGQVTKDFGSIFGTLLPGANAKLQPLEGQSIMAGLEVKVSLGNVWKESLSELSGGQRSLVALSLILAMLLFKPAPLYILDEVDAALDLSHTQNIGNMLKTHFKQSQFIIVSLKDGMFNNANVLFRTKFVDGVSTVMRTVSKNHG